MSRLWGWLRNATSLNTCTVVLSFSGRPCSQAYGSAAIPASKRSYQSDSPETSLSIMSNEVLRQIFLASPHRGLIPFRMRLLRVDAGHPVFGVLHLQTEWLQKLEST